MHRYLVATLVIGALHVASCGQSPAQPYLLDLGTLGGKESQANAVSSNGWVTGWSQLPGKTLQRAFVWSAGTGMIDIGSLGKADIGVAVNNLGQAVGSYVTNSSNSSYRAFYWSASTGLVDIGVLGGLFSRGTAINSSGQVTGYSTFGKTDVWHAFVWSKTGGSTDIGSLGGNSISPVAINDAGQVTGTAELASPAGRWRAFFWSQNTGMIDIGTLGGLSSDAAAMNANGQVVGSSDLVAGKRHAFLWSRSTGLLDLGPLGGDWSSATGINDAGQVVGISTLSGGGPSHAFMWSKDTGMIDLGAPGGGDTVFNLSISASGNVTGVASFPNGDSHAIFWSPGTGLIDLGSLGGKVTAWTTNIANGPFVGTSTLANGLQHAFITSNEENPLPYLQTINPSSALMGSGPISITVTGSNFNARTTVRWTLGSVTVDLPTHRLSNTRVMADVSNSLLSKAGTAKVSVLNPSPGGGTTQTTSFLIGAPKLVLTATATRNAVSGVITVIAQISNSSAWAATNTIVSKAMLSAKPTTSALPVNLGTILEGGNATVNLNFPGTSFAAGTTQPVKLSGTFAGGSFNVTYNLVVP